MQIDISEMYFLLTETNDNGNAIMRNMRKRAYLTVSSLFDLQLSNVIVRHDKTLIVNQPLPTDFSFFNVIVEVVEDRRGKSFKHILRHLVLNRKINRTIYEGIGQQLLFQNKATQTMAHGLLRRHISFSPKQPAIDSVITEIHHELLASHSHPSLKIVALVALLNRSHVLRNHFSKSEQAQLTKRLKQLQQQSEYTEFFEFAKWIDDFITAMIVAASSSHG